MAKRRAKAAVKKEEYDLSQYSEDDLNCRVGRHPWKKVRSAPGAHAWNIAWECRNCGTTKDEFISPLTGARYGRTEYKYAEGYLIKSAKVRKPTINEYRMEMIERDSHK